MTTTNMISELVDITITPDNSTGPGNTTAYTEIDLQHNFQARIGYYYPLRATESIVGFLGNFMVIVAVARYKELQTATGSLLANLAVADILGASLVVFSIVGETMDRTTRWLHFCISKEILYIISAYGNITSLTMISIDRLISVSNPWWYHANMKMSKVLPYQIIVWIVIILTYSLVLTLRSAATLSIPTCVFPFLLSLEDGLLFMAYPIMLCTCITIANYIVLCFIVWKKGRTVAAHGPSVTRQMLQRHRQLSKTTALMLLIYIALTAPVSITSYMVGIADYSVHFEYIALIIWHLNSVINPFIYAYRISKFRRAFRKLMGLKRANAVAPAPTPIAGAPLPAPMALISLPALLAAPAQGVMGNVHVETPGI